MLTAVLDRLTMLASRHFIVGAFMPLLVAAFVNCVVLYLEFDWFRSWAGPQISGTARAFDAAAVFIGLAIVAHVLWSLSGYLRQLLEGQHVAETSALGRWLRQTQLERFRALRREWASARESAAEIMRSKPGWTNELTKAAVDGVAAKQNSYDGTGPAGEALKGLRERRAAAQWITVADLRKAVAALKCVLEQNSVAITNPDDAPNVLQADRRDLLTLFDYAGDEWLARELALANDLQARFGLGAVAPTALGNVGASMQSYAWTRYGLNLATFWSRLQPVLQKHQDFYAVLQEAKVQLDFLVASVFLSAATTIVWVLALPVWGRSVWVFLAVAVLGPCVTVVCYRAAVENYIAFGEIVRTSLDLYRLDLIEALHLPRPRSLRQERVLWQALRRVNSFGEGWVDFSYQTPSKNKQ